MNKKHIDFQNTKISYKTFGTGNPLMLVHGFAEDSTVWDQQVEFLKDKFFLIIPDLAGSGPSLMFEKEEAGLEDHAASLKAILVEEKIEKVVMIGHSMGGYITLAFVEKYPEMIAAFGLFHSSGYADDAEKIKTRKKAIEFIRANGSEAFLKTSIPNLFFDQSNLSPINSLIEKGSSFRPEALIQYYNAMIARPDRTKQLKDATVPVLFILGEHDKAVPFDQGLQQTHLPAQSYINILRYSAHMGMLEETPESNEILANFLQTVKL